MSTGHSTGGGQPEGGAHDPTRPWSAAGHGARASHGVLVLHGFTGSPASVNPWAEHLNAEGWTVSVPLLPGHGTTWQDMNTTGWSDWYDAAEAALDDLLSRCASVSVAGLSMGGCLALRLAAHRDADVTSLMLVNPAVTSRDRRLVAVPALKRFVGSIGGVSNDIKLNGVHEYAYSRVPLKALDSMRELWRLTATDLPQVTAPLLLLRSEVDHVVDPSSARLIVTRVSSRVITERVLHDSFHVATLDHDAEVIHAESGDFLARHGGTRCVATASPRGGVCSRRRPRHAGRHRTARPPTRPGVAAIREPLARGP